MTAKAFEITAEKGEKGWTVSVQCEAWVESLPEKERAALYRRAGSTLTAEAKKLKPSRFGGGAILHDGNETNPFDRDDSENY